MSIIDFDLPAVSPTVPLPPVAAQRAVADPRLPDVQQAFGAQRIELDSESLEADDAPRARESLKELHRIQEVRREQGISIRRAAQLMQCTTEQARAMEQPTTDLTLAQVYEWQRVLDVPVADLLVEPDEALSPLVLQRARMVRLMKTVQAIIERSNQPTVHRLAETLAHQLVEVMPELKGVTSWHSIERRKTCNQNARILESDYLRGPDDDQTAE